MQLPRRHRQEIRVRHGVELHPGNSGHKFRWKPGGGQTWAFEVVAKLPINTGEEDPGWWSTDGKWTNELDFFEFWGWGHSEYYAGLPVWKYSSPASGPSVYKEIYKAKSEVPNPEASFHRYTTVINANNAIEEYIDGVKRWTLPTIESAKIAQPWMGLILSHALRESSANFTSGSRSFDVRSVAIYQDAKHAGVNIENGGIAPGTTIAGEAPKEEQKEPPKEEPAKEQPPREEAPRATRPHAPSGFTAVSLKTAVKLAFNANPAEDHVTEYRLYRAGRNYPGHTAGTPWTTGPASSLSFTNAYEVEPGTWLCYKLAAVNAKGESPRRGPICLTV